MNINNAKPTDSKLCSKSTGNCIVSYVIVSWNAKEYLKDCIYTILLASQSFEYEIIVVDNASTDGSSKMIQNKFPQVELICNNENAGFSKANNQGIEIARGRYICLVNSDVLILPGAIQYLLDEMEQNPKIGIIGPKVLNSDLSLQHSCRNLPTIKSAFFRALKLDTTFPHSRLFGQYQLTHWNYNRTRNVAILSGCFWLIRRSALDQVGTLDTRFYIYGEDMDLCKRFTSMGWEIIFNPGAQIIHYGGASSANAPVRFWIEMQRADLKYWLKHHGRFQAYVYYTFLILHNIVRSLGYGLRYLIFSQKDTFARAGLEKSKKGLKWLLARETIKSVMREEL